MKTQKYYSVQELATLSGVSARTLHYYDEMGLLVPVRRENNYRSYGDAEVDRLQQILLYREIGVSLTDIKRILDDPVFDEKRALHSHLASLKTQQERIGQLIASVEKTLASKERNTTMSDTEKFEGFKKKLIEENEEKYGAEIREKYGDDAVDGSNAKMMGLTEAQYQEMQSIAAEIMQLLHEGMELGDPASEVAQRACDLHRQWLNFTWKEGMYNKEAHKGLAEMYVADERFKKYYDAEVPGTAEFLRDAIAIYCA